MLKLAPRPAIIPHAKINPKWIEDLNASRDTIKVLAENTGSEISYIPQSNTFANASPRTRKIKEKKINKWDYIKLKSFCTAKETIIKMKRDGLYGRTYLPMIYRTRV